MRPTVALLLLSLSMFVPAASAQTPGFCSTPSPLPEARGWFVELAEAARNGPKRKLAKPIPVAFHVLTDGRNGKLSRQAIEIMIRNLNFAYRDAPFSFRLSSVDTTTNAAWFNNCVVSNANLQKIRKRLAKDSRYYLNVYSCRLGEPGFYGVATFPPGYPVPNPPALGYLQGVAIDPITVGGSEMFRYGFVLAHEVGHYLGLFHTFETYFNPGRLSCADPGDTIPDTPTQAGNTFGQCPIGRDSCPTFPGRDDIPNFMNYATDSCWDHFSLGQNNVMALALQRYRPTLGSR